MKKLFLFIALPVIILIAFAGDVNAQCGSDDRAHGKTVNKSTADVVGPAANAVDGDIATYWKPAGTGGAEWLYVDLGASYKVCRVLIKWGRWNAPSAFKIEVTNTDPTQSGVTWTEIDNVTNNNPPAEPGDTYVYNDQTITATNNSRYLRLYLPSVSSSDNFWVKELMVYSEVVNQAPTVNLTAPSGNVTVNVNTPVSLSATASDPDGTISKVEFFHSTSSLIDQAPQSTSPYSITWTPTTPGTYTITAKATDNNNASTTSSSVTVTVNAASTGGWLLQGNTGASGNYIGTNNSQPFIIKTDNIERMRVNPNGWVLINTTNPKAELTVNGTVVAKKIQVTQNNWPDYVFDSTYKLMPLPTVEEFIRKHGHLPDVPSAKTVEQDGLSVGDNQAVLLRKIEELTLYMIEQDKRIKQLEAKLKTKQDKKKKTNK